MSKGVKQRGLTPNGTARVLRMRNQSERWGSKTDPRLMHSKTLGRLLRVING